jgi:molybdate transport system substrate-binding protein
MPLNVVRSSVTRNAVWTVLALVVSVAQAGCKDDKSPPGSDVTTPGADASADATDASPNAPDASADATASLSLFAAGATQAAVMAGVSGFAAQSGLTITYTFGSAGSLRDQILTGTSGADVAIVTPAVVTALDAKGFVHAGSRVDLAQIGSGLAVRSADQLPDISDSDKFKAALLAADEIYYADPALGTAGAAFIKDCMTLGIADACAAAPAGKGHPFATGADAMAAMALSTAATVVGATQISEIKATSGVKLVAEYPAAPINLQVKTVYTAVIVEGTQDLANAERLLQFLTGDSFMSQLAVYGFEPIPAP